MKVDHDTYALLLRRYRVVDHERYLGFQYSKQNKSPGFYVKTSYEKILLSGSILLR